MSKTNLWKVEIPEGMVGFINRRINRLVKDMDAFDKPLRIALQEAYIQGLADALHVLGQRDGGWCIYE